MSIENMTPDHVCYIHCNFCNTFLAVDVPSNTVCPTIVTVRCGHCANMLPINMAAALQPLSHDQDQLIQQLFHLLREKPHKPNIGPEEVITEASGSSPNCKGKKFNSFECTEQLEQPRMPTTRPPEKRQRVPSAYNRFIKEEIQRIKASNPGIGHREAFSTAAKNWAHFPHIQFGLKLEKGNKEAKLDHHHSFTSPASSTDHHHNSHAPGFY